ncbi:MAG: ORF6N domain-containing protein [Patescibacteria group bacterium]|nr:ORF6N domain-containing protein [Patescibacteria group bacterium]
MTHEFIARRIFFVRGQKVMLDRDLAELYQVENKRLNEQVKRNISRFPIDFMFQLNAREVDALMRSQIATASGKRRNIRFRPYAFTELGISMLSSVLNSEQAVQMNIFIMRAFVRLRRMVSRNKDLETRVDKLEINQMKQELGLAEVYGHVKKFMPPLHGQDDLIILNILCNCTMREAFHLATCIE